MSNKLDERITRIRFDNDQFERGVATSMQSLDRLKNKLESTESVDAFSGITKSAEKTDLSGIERAIDSVGDKFSALRMIAINVLSDIATQAINTGVALVKNLSTDNIAIGWQKYNEEVSAVQTIMVTLDDTPIEEVEDRLAKISWYSDETSYSYEQMVSAMSKLISSGVGLDDATNAVIGLANASAAAGVSTTKAQQAFYNFSQAFGAGYMKNIDWRSIEMLNMGTPEFKKNIVETAYAMNKLVKVGDDMYVAADKYGKKNWQQHIFGINNMADSLKDKWFDKDVMNKVLNTYSEFANQVYEFQNAWDKDTASETMKQLKEMGLAVDNVSTKAFEAAQEAKTLAEALDSVKDAVSSKWKDTFKALFGNYEEAKVLWTDLANALYKLFAASGDVRNDILAQWNDPLSFMVPDEKVRAAYKFPEFEAGRDILIKGLWNIYDSIVNVVNLIKSTWNEIFPQLTAKRLYEFTKKFRDVTETIKESTKDMPGLKRFLTGVFTVLKKVFDFGKSIFNLAKKLWPVVQRLFTLAVKVADALIGFGKSIVSFIINNVDLEPILDLISNGIETVIEWLDKINGKDISIPAFQTIIDWAGKIVEKVGPAKETIKSIFDYVWAKATSDETKEGIKNLTDSITLFGTKTGTIGYYIGYVFGSLGTFLVEFIKFLLVIFGKIMEIVGKILDWVRGRIEGLSTEGLLKTLIIAGIAKFLIDLGRIVISIRRIAGAFGNILDSISDLIYSFARKNNAALIKSIAMSVLMVAGSLFLLSKIDKDQMLSAIGGLTAVTVCIGALYVVMRTVDEYYKKTSGKRRRLELKNFGFVGLGIAILSMVLAMKSIAKMLNDENMTLGRVLGIAGIVLGIAAALSLISIGLTRLSGNNHLGLSVLYPVSIALAILLMIRAFKAIDQMELEHVGKIVLTILGVLGTLFLAGLAMKQISVKSGIGVLLFAITFKVILGTFEKIQKMSFELNAQTGVIIGAVLGIMAIFVAYAALLKMAAGSKAGGGGKLLAASASMMLMAMSFIAIAAAFRILNGVRLETIITGGVILMGILSVMIGLMAVAGKAKARAFASISSLAVLSIGLSILLGSIALLSESSPKGVLVSALSLGVIVGAFIGLMVAAGKAKVKVAAGVLSLSVLSVGLSLLVMALKFLAKEDIGKIWNSVAVITVVLLDILGVYYLLGKMKAPGFKAISAIITITVTGALLGGALVLFSALIEDATKAIEVAVAIGAFALALSATLYLLDKLNTSVKLKDFVPLLVSMGLAGVVIGGLIAGFSAIMQGQNLDWLKKYGLQLLAAIGVILGIFAVVSLFGKAKTGAIEAAIYGSAALAIVVVAIVGIIALIGTLIGALTNGFTDVDTLKNALNEMIEISFLIGAILNALISGLFVGGARLVSQELSAFSEGLLTFAKTISKFPDNFADKAFIFGKAILNLSWFGLLSSIFGGIGKHSILEKLAIQLEKVAPHLKNVANTFSKADTNGLKNVKAVLDTLKSMGEAIKAFPIFGFASFISLKLLSGALQSYVDSIKDLTKNDVLKATYVAAILQIFSDIKTPTKGLFSTSQGLAGFALNFGIAIALLKWPLSNLAEIDRAEMTKAQTNAPNLIDLLSSFNDLVEGMDKSGGLWAAISGGKLNTLYGEVLAIAIISWALQKPIENLAGYSSEDLQKAVTTSEELVKFFTNINNFSTELDKSGGLVQAITGTTINSIEKLPGIAESIVKYGNVLIDPRNVSAITAASSVTKDLSTAFHDFVDQDMTTRLNNLSMAITGLANSGIDKIQYFFSDEATKTAIDSAVNNLVEKWYWAFLGEAQLNRIGSYLGNVVNVALTYVESTYGGKFYNAGNYLRNRFIDGFKSKFSEVKQAGQSMGNMAVLGVGSKEGLDENSPSIKMFSLGEFAGIGLSNGMINTLDLVSTAGEVLGAGAAASTATAFHSGLAKLDIARTYNRVFTNPKLIKTNNFWDTVKDWIGFDIVSKDTGEVKEFSEVVEDVIGNVTGLNQLDLNNLGLDKVFEQMGASSDLEKVVKDYSDIFKTTITETTEEGAKAGAEATIKVLKNMPGLTNVEEVITDSFSDIQDPFGISSIEEVVEYFEEVQEKYAEMLNDPLNGFSDWSMSDWLNSAGLNDDYTLSFTPVLTDENGNEYGSVGDYANMLSGSYGGTVAGYSAEDVQNLTKEIYHLEDALYSLKNAMQDQKVTHSGELTIKYTNESDFIDRIQNAVIGDIRRGIRS